MQRDDLRCKLGDLADTILAVGKGGKWVTEHLHTAADGTDTAALQTTPSAGHDKRSASCQKQQGAKETAKLCEKKSGRSASGAHENVGSNRHAAASKCSSHTHVAEPATPAKATNTAAQARVCQTAGAQPAVATGRNEAVDLLVSSGDDADAKLSEPVAARSGLPCFCQF